MVTEGNKGVLMPCAGNGDPDRQMGHVYCVYRDNGREETMSIADAKLRYGDFGYHISSSRALCSDCYTHLGSKAENGKPLSADNLCHLISNKVGAVRCLVKLSRKKHEPVFGELREIKREFNAGLRWLIVGLSRGSLDESKDVSEDSLREFLDLSLKLDWQDLSDNTWKTIYSQYEMVTGDDFLSRA